MSLYEGITHLFHPAEITDPLWSYIVLGIALLAEGASWFIALKTILSRKGEKSFWQAVRQSKDPSVYTVLAEDSAAIAGVLVAFLGVYLGHRFKNPYFDGAASILIGLILAAVAVFLVFESRGLLVGESADEDLVLSIQDVAAQDPAVQKVFRPLTMHFGPEEVLLNIDIQFRPNLSAEKLASAVDRLEKSIRQKHPKVKRIFIETEAFRGTAGEKITRDISGDLDV